MQVVQKERYCTVCYPSLCILGIVLVTYKYKRSSSENYTNSTQTAVHSHTFQNSCNGKFCPLRTLDTCSLHPLGLWSAPCSWDQLLWIIDNQTLDPSSHTAYKRLLTSITMLLLLTAILWCTESRQHASGALECLRKHKIAEIPKSYVTYMVCTCVLFSG